MSNKHQPSKPFIEKEEGPKELTIPNDSLPTNQNVLEDQPSDSSPISGEPTHNQAGQIVKVTANSLNVRKGPGKEHPVLFRLPKGTKVEVTNDEDKTWILILASGDRLGYVMRVFVVPVES